MTAIKDEKYLRSKVCPTSAFSIAKIGKIAKNKLLASASILSLLGREMIEIYGLGTDLE